MEHGSVLFVFCTWHLLLVMVFWLGWILYRDAHCMVKMGAGLSWPIPVN